MSEAVRILTEARDLIKDPAHWTKGNYARDKSGWNTSVESEDAFCWCSIGAIKKVAKTQLSNPVPYQVSEAFEKVGVRTCFDLVQFNDNHTHEQVIGLFDRAIAAATKTQEN